MTKAIMAAAGAAMALAAMTAAPAAARGHHGFHAHRGLGFHSRRHCRWYKDQSGYRQRVCV